MKFRGIIFPLVTLLVGLLGNGAPLSSTRELVTSPAVRTTEVASFLVRDWQEGRSLNARAGSKKPKPKPKPEPEPKPEPVRAPTPEPRTEPLTRAIKDDLWNVIESLDASKITELPWRAGQWNAIHGLGTSEMQDYKLASMKGSDGFYHIGIFRVGGKKLKGSSLVTVSWSNPPKGQDVKNKILAALNLYHTVSVNTS